MTAQDHYALLNQLANKLLSGDKTKQYFKGYNPSNHSGISAKCRILIVDPAVPEAIKPELETFTWEKSQADRNYRETIGAVSPTAPRRFSLTPQPKKSKAGRHVRPVHPIVPSIPSASSINDIDLTMELRARPEEIRNKIIALATQ